MGIYALSRNQLAICDVEMCTIRRTFLVGVDASDMPLEVLPPGKAFPTSADVTEIHAGAQRRISWATPSARAAHSRDSAAP